MLNIVEAGYRPEKYEEHIVECPACKTGALMSGSVTVDFDEDWDHRERVLVNVHPYFTFVPSRLRCGACGLELEGHDQLAAAGVADEWQLEDVDERDYFDPDHEW